MRYTFNKFRSSYNKCIKKLFGYARMDSMSGILINLSLPTADTIVHNSHILFFSTLFSELQHDCKLVFDHRCMSFLKSYV